MGLSKIVQSHGWKNFMAKLYGWGAALVILGALFKINHYPGASIMLIIGMGTECIIFFFSAFEPPHEEVDWSIVYPELAGIADDDEVNVKANSRLNNTNSMVTTDGAALVKFNDMIDKAGENNLFEKFGQGLSDFSNKVQKMSDISDTTLSTKSFADGIENATETVKELTDSYKSAAGALNSVNETITYSVDNLTEAYNSASSTIKTSTEEFASASKNITSSMDIDFTALKEGNKEYSDKVNNLNKNLAALNAIFELQLNEADLDKMMTDLQGSVKHSRKYHDQITQLGDRIEQLNTVYGNMLSALNVKS